MNHCSMWVVSRASSATDGTPRNMRQVSEFDFFFSLLPKVVLTCSLHVLHPAQEFGTTGATISHILMSFLSTNAEFNTVAPFSLIIGVLSVRQLHVRTVYSNSEHDLPSFAGQQHLLRSCFPKCEGLAFV